MNGPALPVQRGRESPLPATRRNLGWLGPAIVLAGTAVAGLGVWYFLRARPAAGDVIDRIPVDDRRALVVRAEAGGDRA
ncbi:MAG TPA: hypothetical protein VF469_29030, partial [Kofleriaceae bacterium]